METSTHSATPSSEFDRSRTQANVPNAVMSDLMMKRPDCNRTAIRRPSPRRCGEDPVLREPPSTANQRLKVDSNLLGRTLNILLRQETIASQREQERFVDCIIESRRRKSAIRKRWSNRRCEDDDIISLIQKARDSGDLDEAVWRAYLAAHFGRASADPKVPHQVESAAMLLCAFGREPYWTWRRISRQPAELRPWLASHASEIKSLSFGNHRKFEAKKPRIIFDVLSSFLKLVDECGGPADLIAIDGEVKDAGVRFDVLYQRLKPLLRFNRTGRFDFLELLIDLDMLDAEPSRCYLAGATGPKRGAELLWGEHKPRLLDDLAAQLAKELAVSAQTIEDSLCNWQKPL